jgi:two-component sensor histidine kinase
MQTSDPFVGVEGQSSPLRESNHRIANNLMTIATMLRYQSRELAKIGTTFSVDDVREILSDVGHRIELVSRLHRRLAEPIAPDMLNLSPYLNDVAQTAIDSLSPPGEVALEPISGDMCPVRSNQALLIGLIVGELATGAVKIARRANAGCKLKLTCGPAAGGIEIALASDGVGVSGSYDPDRDGSFGYSVVKLLVRQLKATLTFQSIGAGIVTRLAVPTGFDLAELNAAGEA